MATTAVKPAVPSPSFAKVAASQLKPESPTTTSNTTASTSEAYTALSASTPSFNPSEVGAAVHNGKLGARDAKESPAMSSPDQMNDAVGNLRIKDEVRSSTSKSSDEDKVPRSTSDTSSRKPPSLDGKSTTSGTTFGLDEKESLRPDDSASVMAAEEDEAFSAPGSIAPGSRLGSETGAKAFRDQFHEISERMGYPVTRGPAAPRPQPVARPSDVPQSLANAPTEVVSGPTAPPASNSLLNGGLPLGFSSSVPDEKLLEALETPKDRLFLLRLEQDVIEFVKDSKEPMMDLPPCNSFCRLLIHKLADYYFLTHFVDTTANSVRIYRTPFCRLPPPLTGISNPPTSGNTPPPSAQAMKIMRRGGSGKEASKGDGSAGISGKGSSKGSSEEGGDDESRRESTSKDKSNMSREEREAAYKLARERIFKDFPEESEATTATADERKELSRSDSSNDKLKSTSVKQKNNRDDGFEARSTFNVSRDYRRYGEISTHESHVAHRGHVPTMVPGLRPPEPTPHDRALQHDPFVPPQPPPQWQDTSCQLPPNSQYPHVPGHGPAQGYGPLPPSGFNPAGGVSPRLAYPHLMHGTPPFHPWTQGPPPPVNGYGSYPQPQHPPHPQHDPPWQNAYQPSYPSPGSHHSHSPGPASRPPIVPPASNGTYPYGQLPSPWYPANGQKRFNQHPLPGSFNRNAFNPQTQAFVPGGQPQNYDQYGNAMGGGSSIAPSMSPNGYQGNNGSMHHAYNTPPHQGINSSPHRPNLPQSRNPSQPHSRPNSNKPSPSPKAFSSPAQYTQHPPQNNNPHHHPEQSLVPLVPQQSTLSKWGTPANLPPKPPAPNPSLGQGSGPHGDISHSLPPVPPPSQQPQQGHVLAAAKNTLPKPPLVGAARSGSSEPTTLKTNAVAAQPKGDKKAALPAKIASPTPTAPSDAKSDAANKA